MSLVFADTHLTAFPQEHCQTEEMRNESHALSIAFAFWCERLLWEALMKFTCHPFRGKFLSSVFPLHIDRQQTHARSRQLSLAVPSRHQVHRRRSTPAPLPVHVLWFHISVPFGRFLTAHFCGVLHPTKNPFTIYTIEHPEMLHFPEKIFEVCIYAQFCDHQIVKDAQILFSGRDLQKKIPFCIDLCYNKKKHRKNRRHDRQLCETCA